MKKFSIYLVLSLFATPSFAQQIPEKFARDLDKISAKYSSDMRQFLKSLPSNTVEFNSAQKATYCGFVSTYINDFYQLTQKNKESLPFSYANMTKHDIALKVEQSKEMQILQRYNIKCELD